MSLHAYAWLVVGVYAFAAVCTAATKPKEKLSTPADPWFWANGALEIASIVLVVWILST